MVTKNGYFVIKLVVLLIIVVGSVAALLITNHHEQQTQFESFKLCLFEKESAFQKLQYMANHMCNTKNLTKTAIDTNYVWCVNSIGESKAYRYYGEPKTGFGCDELAATNTISYLGDTVSAAWCVMPDGHVTNYEISFGQGVSGVRNLTKRDELAMRVCSNKSMLTTAIDWATDYGQEDCWVYCSDNNNTARAFKLEV